MMHDLRRAIAGTFPDRYTEEGWLDLLPDFINLEMSSYLALRAQYRVQVLTDPLATEPTISPELRQATTLLAKRGAVSYEQLALGYYRQRLELQATEQHNQHLQQQFTAAVDLCRDSIEMAKRAAEELRLQEELRQARIDVMLEHGLLTSTQAEHYPIDGSGLESDFLIPTLEEHQKLVERLRAEEAGRG